MLKFSQILFLFISNITFAQEVIWADRVVEKSSEKTDSYYSPKNTALQILGKPNVLPQTISSPCAWQPNGSDYGEDYIKVSFSKAIQVKQIIVAENWNAGAIARIFGFDENNKQYELYENKEISIKQRGRIWNVIIPQTAFKVVAVKILIVHELSKGIKQIDAIGISESDIKYTAQVNVVEDKKEKLIKENLGEGVNSRFGEVAPIVTPDGKLLFFTRKKHPNNIAKSSDKESISNIKQDIWISKIGKTNLWQNAENIGKPINNEDENAAATVSADGKTLFVLNKYNPDGSMTIGLSKSKFKDKSWQFPQEVKINGFQALKVYKDNSKGDGDINTEFSITPDEKVLIMGLKRSNTFGDKDLYFSFKNADGSYSQPENLGNVINTAANEGSPFMAADNKTLYFNSNGHPGFGDSDIFVTTRLDDTWKNWSEPKNLGPIINSPQWDGYFSIPASGEFAYLCSDKNSLGAEDIFKVKLTESLKPNPVIMLDLAFTDMLSGKLLNPKIELTSIDSGKVIQETLSFREETSDYSTFIKAGSKYNLSVSLDGYVSQTETLDYSKEKFYREIRKTIKMVPLKAGQSVILQNLFFQQGNAVIDSSSYQELDKIVKLLQDFPNMEIKLEGHSDNQGDLMLNIKLANDRVVNVKQYIVSKGNIDATRITTKSWGPTRPISSNSSEESRKKNRRVEFMIIKM
jgi:outer membrane protein OmpA-like peptidoglycan-associated protein